MLFNVLKVDIVRSEKTKLEDKKTNCEEKQCNDDLWLELRAWFNGRSMKDQKTSLRDLRDFADIIIEEIKSIGVRDNTSSEEPETIMSLSTSSLDT